MATTLNNSGVVFPDATTQTTAATSEFTSGVRMIFAQNTAPTGWTKDTTNYNNHALRVVTGTAGTGGSSDFTTAFGTPAVSGSVSVSGSVGNTTLATSQIPAHSHGRGHAWLGTGSQGSYANPLWDQKNGNTNFNTNNTGGGGSHNHSFSGSGSLSSASVSINVRYLDVITATKN